MDLEMGNNVTKLSVNMFEYCIVAERTYLPTNEIKVYIPKLTTNTKKGTFNVPSTILCNDAECKPDVKGPIKLTDTLTVKTFSGLELSRSAILKKEECNCRLEGSGGDICTHRFVRDCRGDETKFIDGHIVEAYIEEGTQMIVCFMDNNVNDGYMTNFI